MAEVATLLQEREDQFSTLHYIALQRWLLLLLFFLLYMYFYLGVLV